jgi:hypothetical protein
VNQRQVIANSSRKQASVEFDFFFGGAYVEDHKSRFHAAGSPNHGCNECCIRLDSDRQKRANDWHSPAHRDSTGSKEIVMAKVIEFYIPKNFRKPLSAVAEPQLGKIIEFRPLTKRSA